MNMINMAECIKPNKTQLNTKFIIKAKPSSSHKHSEAETDTPLPLPTDQEIHQFINYMITKSKKYKELLESNKITDDMLFSDKHLYSNKYIRTLLKSIIGKLFTDKRLGKNLKGINKSLLQEIEVQIWDSLEREVALFQLEVIYQEQREDLEKELEDKTNLLEKEIERIERGQYTLCLN